MLPGFAGEFARKDALVPRRDCAHLAAKPCVSQSLPRLFLWWLQAQVSPRVYLAVIREPMGAGSTSQAMEVRRTEKTDVSKMDYLRRLSVSFFLRTTFAGWCCLLK